MMANGLMIMDSVQLSRQKYLDNLLPIYSGVLQAIRAYCVHSEETTTARCSV
jgi:hypothetical protein